MANYRNRNTINNFTLSKQEIAILKILHQKDNISILEITMKLHKTDKNIIYRCSKYISVYRSLQFLNKKSFIHIDKSYFKLKPDTIKYNQCLIILNLDYLNFLSFISHSMKLRNNINNTIK